MKTIISVDIQPSSKQYIDFNLQDYIEYVIQQVGAGNKVIIFYNSFDIEENDLLETTQFFEDLLREYYENNFEINYLEDSIDYEDEDDLYIERENLIDDMIIDFLDNEDVVFISKQYAHFRAFEGYGNIDEDDIVELIRILLKDDKFSLNEYTADELRKRFYDDPHLLGIYEHIFIAHDNGEYFGFNHNVANVLSGIEGKVVLLGGGERECLWETEIELTARNIEFEKNYNFIY